jgi:hypothetical protein
MRGAPCAAAAIVHALDARAADCPSVGEQTP